LFILLEAERLVQTASTFRLVLIPHPSSCEWAILLASAQADQDSRCKTATSDSEAATALGILAA